MEDYHKQLIEMADHHDHLKIKQGRVGMLADIIENLEQIGEGYYKININDIRKLVENEIKI